MPGTNRAQHYVSQLYLKWFIDPNLEREGKQNLWVYEKGEPPRHAAPREVAHQRDFYSFDHGGERNNLVDEYFQSLESGRTKETINRFAHAGTVSNVDKDLLAKFVGTLSARVPIARVLVNDVAGGQMTDQLSPFINEPLEFRRRFEALQVPMKTPVDPETVRQQMLEGESFQQADPFINLRMMLDLAENNYQQLLEMNWTVLHSDGNSHFVTSDNPVVSVLPRDGGGATLGLSFKEQRIQVVFPLSPVACLLASRARKPAIQVFSGHRVCLVNKGIMTMAHRWLFASENSSRIAAVFDKIGATGALEMNFYDPDDGILRRKDSCTQE